MDVDFIWTSMYRTTIGIGNPQVQFRAQVDTSWGPLFVPSIYCKNQPCWMHSKHMYNPLNSSTSNTNLTGCQATYTGQLWGLWTWGNETQDIVLVGDLEIENQTFESVEYWKPNPFEREDLYDAVLGLALRDIRDYNTTLHSPSLFQSMLQQRLLDDEVFTLRLSRTDEEIGELTLGGIQDYIDKDEMVHISLTRNYEGASQTARYYSSNGWQVALKDITVSHDRSTNLSVLASSHTAILSNSFPWITLPSWDEAKAIWSALGFEGGDVSCDVRPRLPNITFVFGPDGQEVSLTSWDYVLEVYNPILGRLDCQIMIGGMDEEESNGFVLLGSPFLNGLYSVWDAGRKRVSFANRPL